jgi:acetyl esterase/lipase
MKRFRFVLLMSALSMTAGDTLLAQRPAGDAAGFAAFTGYRTVPNITYTTASGVELKLDFYGPARPAGATPTAIFMHGGGYRIGSRKGSISAESASLHPDGMECCQRGVSRQRHCAGAGSGRGCTFAHCAG